jgi:hypothetical protein
MLNWIILYLDFMRLGYAELKRSKWYKPMKNLRLLFWIAFSAVFGLGLIWIVQKAHAFISYSTQAIILLSLASFVLLGWIELLRRAHERIVNKAERLAERITRLEDVAIQGSTLSVILQDCELHPSHAHAWRDSLARALKGMDATEFDKLNETGMPNSREEQRVLVNQYLNLLRPRIDRLKEVQRGQLANRPQTLLAE